MIGHFDDEPSVKSGSQYSINSHTYPFLQQDYCVHSPPPPLSAGGMSLRPNSQKVDMEVDTPMHTMKIIHTEESDTGVASTVLHIRSCSKIISYRGGTQFHLLKNVIFIMTTNIYSFSTSVAPDRGTFRTLPNI